VGYIPVAVACELTVGEVDDDTGAPSAQSRWIWARCLSLAVDCYGILIWRCSRNMLLYRQWWAL